MIGPVHLKAIPKVERQSIGCESLADAFLRAFGGAPGRVGKEGVGLGSRFLDE